MATFAPNVPIVSSATAVLHSPHPIAGHDSFIQWFRESKRDIRNLGIFDRSDDHFPNNRNLHREKEDDEEIGVFGAEKYFNGDDEDDSGSTQMPARVPTMYQGENYVQRKNAEGSLMGISKLKVCLEPPRLLSHSCSSSQNALVGSFPKPRSRKWSGKAKRRTFLQAFCRCACLNKDSVDALDISDHAVAKNFAGHGSVERIKETTRMPFRFPHDLHHPNFDVGNWMREENHKVHCKYGMERLGGGKSKDSSFSFTQLSGVSSLRNVEEGKPWKSLGAFGAPCSDKRSHSLELDRKMSMIPSASLAPKPLLHATISASSRPCCNKDDDSDCSSDLIEIESLSGKVISYFGGHDSSMASGCLTPATCYEPSETSIDWSIVTASAANMSVMSEHDQELGTQNPTGSPTRLSFSKENVKNMSWSEWNRKFTTPPPHTYGRMRLAAETDGADDQRQRRLSSSQLPPFSSFNRLSSVYTESPNLTSSTERSLLPRSRPPLDSRLLFI